MRGSFQLRSFAVLTSSWVWDSLFFAIIIYFFPVKWFYQSSCKSPFCTTPLPPHFVALHPFIKRLNFKSLIYLPHIRMLWVCNYDTKEKNINSVCPFFHSHNTAYIYTSALSQLCWVLLLSKLIDTKVYKLRRMQRRRQQSHQFEFQLVYQVFSCFSISRGLL